MDTDYQLALSRFKKLVEQMLIAQDDYLKNKSDQGKSGKYYSLRDQVKNVISPKVTSQAKIDWLGQ